jgi:alginate O-acetyltransferase complex protein AlgJ
VASGILVQTTVEIRSGQGSSALEVFRQKPTAANLRAYERSLEDSSVLARTLRPWFQWAQFAWLRDGGEKVLVGRKGWLFYKPGFDDMVSRGNARPHATNDPATAVVAWRDALAARGIQLLVVPAPNKESIYSDYLTRARGWEMP